MEYKALIFDLDGTGVANRQDALPTPRVIEAVKKAKEKVLVSVATGRPLTLLGEIFHQLELESPCVISGGTQIINPKTEEVISDFPLTPQQVKRVVDTCLKYPYKIIFNDELAGFSAGKRRVFGDERIIFIMDIPEDKIDNVLTEIRLIPSIAAHKVKSWTPNRFDVHITHTLATKKHAIEKLLAILGVKKEEVIAVGDSNNDLPLFESSGFKVAMGNGSEELKSQADFITSSVDEDGLAEVIEKYIL